MPCEITGVAEVVGVFTIGYFIGKFLHFIMEKISGLREWR